MRDLALRHLGGIVALAIALLLLGIAASGRLPHAQAEHEFAAGIDAGISDETQLVDGTDTAVRIAPGLGDPADILGPPVAREGALPPSRPLLPPEAGAAGAATGNSTVYRGLAMGLGGLVIAFALGTASLLMRTQARR